MRLHALALLTALALPALAQTEPQNFLAAGAGFNSASSPQANGWISFATRVADKTYSFTTTEFTSNKPNSVRTGVARIVMRAGSMTVLALGDAGAAMGAESFGGAFSAGGITTFDLSKLVKAEGVHLVVALKAVKTAITDAQPVFSFGIGKAF